MTAAEVNNCFDIEEGMTSLSAAPDDSNNCAPMETQTGLPGVASIIVESLTTSDGGRIAR